MDDDNRITPALDAFLGGDGPRLAAELAEDPGLVNLVWNGNTLLEWATQPPHGVDSGVVEVLIEGGAHLDRALNLAACWNLADLCTQLLAAGADPSARADSDITPLESAAMHGSTDSADTLVRHGLHRPSLWLAASAGRLDLVTDWVDDRGRLRKHPGPYRPNWADVGHPAGERPTDEPAEILGEAFVFAAANGRLSVVDYLLDVGISIDSRPYRNTTGLHFAILFKKPDMVGHLLLRGASSSIADGTHSSDATGWAEACNDGSRESQQIQRTIERHADRAG